MSSSGEAYLMQVPPDDAVYDPPIITDLGTLADLTAGPATGTEDGLGGQGGDASGAF